MVSFADHSDSWTRVYASCDGLLLVGDNEGKNFAVNPVTRDIREVPCSPFALDPRDSFIMYGIGYDSAGDDYKIVTLSYCDTDNEYEPDCTDMFINVYSLKTGSWKRAESSPYDHAVGHVTAGVFVNGCIHWLASRTTDFMSAIVAFDLVEEKFREVPPPCSAESDKFVLNHLAELGGCLCMFDNSGTDVWVMKEYDVQESWTQFTIDDPDAIEIRPLCLLAIKIRPLCLLGQEEMVVLEDDEKLVMYHLKEATSKDIVVHCNADDLHAEVSFVESLVSPHGNKETGRE